ncbi:MAG: sigma-54-dependent Fis family transcriptional regulator [Myxococcales bacterium]|nr:sigma-54-dependent Fis family transcriptional regulator [Myxococcales bacterium]
MVKPLILEPPSESEWLDFQSDRRLARAHAVVPHWQRSRKLGASHEGPAPETALERGSALRSREERTEALLSCGASVLDDARRAAHDDNYSLLLADSEGVIVNASAGGSFGSYARRVRLIEGADWSERTRGTNAIGTALSERRPVFVGATAHYARAYHRLVCYAAPVFDADGEMVAVLDATSTFEHADAKLAFGIIGAAHALSELLRMRAYSMAGASVTRVLARSLEQMNSPVAIVEPPGRISRLNAAARLLLGGTNAGASASDVFGVGFDALARLALRAESLHIERALADGAPLRGELRVEPIESEGRLIALLAFFEPAAARSTVGPHARRRTHSHSHSQAPAAPATATFAGLFAEDERTREALGWAARVAASRIPVMLLAETGAGKELVARGIHRASPRAELPFVAVNCGSIAPTLLESELFGYGPSAFSGADKRGREGYLQAASGGTLFLDEVGEMSLGMQAALLRVLEAGAYRRVGETVERHTDVRVVCATCRDLDAMVEDGQFRSDLYFRLKGATVRLPPLRERSDIIALARYLLLELSVTSELVAPPTLSPEVERFFVSYPWPGNVRQLKSTLEVALVMAADDDAIRLGHLPVDLQLEVRAICAPPETAAPSAAASASAASLADAQIEIARAALAAEGGNVSAAARRLGVARSTLYRMIKRGDLRQ